jgi:hypothetical protein
VKTKKQKQSVRIENYPHTCPDCGWQCACTDQPCSCCKIEKTPEDYDFLETLSKSKSVNQIRYPDGSIGYLNKSAIIL